MRKPVSIALVFAFLLFVPVPAIASVKQGATCKKLGQIIISSGKKYTCIKSRNGLVWNKVALVSGALPAPPASAPPNPAPPNPTPSASTTPYRANSFIEILRSPQIGGSFPISQINFQIPSNLPQTWEDVYQNREGIAYKAWLSVSAAVKNSRSALGKIKIAIGPTTLFSSSKTENALELVSRAFSDVRQPTVIDIIVFNYQDQAWANEFYKKLIDEETGAFKTNHQNYVLDMCSSSNKMCWSAMGFTKNNGDGIILLGQVDWAKLRTFDSSYSSFARSEEGLTTAHEYFHTIQRKTIGKNWFVMEYAPPIWFNEATAVYVENGAMNYDSFDNYMRFRAVDSKLAYSSCGSVADGCIPISEDILVNFLSLRHYPNNWSNFPYGMKYEVSNRIIEILVALKGHQSIIDVYSYMAQNHTFDEAFQHIFGISYSSAIPVLAKIVAEQFSNNL